MRSSPLDPAPALGVEEGELLGGEDDGDVLAVCQGGVARVRYGDDAGLAAHPHVLGVACVVRLDCLYLAGQEKMLLVCACL